jgi:hypothetical protein
LAGEPAGGRAVERIRRVAAGRLSPELRQRLRSLAGPALAPLIGAVVTLVLVIPTLAPGVLDWDTAEFQTVGPVLGVAHPTGYPAYVILGWLASIVLPFGDPAYRMNLLQAFLAAGAVSGTVAIVQHMSGMRWVALASGLLFLTMPLAAHESIQLPVSSFATGPTLWTISTHADPHLFHLALVTLIFLLLLSWDQRRHSSDEETARRSGRWLVAAAGVYGLAVANHSLALLLPPAIGLFVLAAAPGIFLERRLVLTCAGVMMATIVLLFAELPIRAAMNAPLVYGRPDTLGGFVYIVLGEQFRGSLIEPFEDLPEKYALVMSALASWLGPLSFLAAAGFGSSLIRRPRYVLLAGLTAVTACWFSASYANADISRYFLVPLFVAYTFVGLGLADCVTVAAWALGVVSSGRSEAQEIDELRETQDLGAVEPAVGAEDAAAGLDDYDFDYQDDHAALPGPPWLIVAVELVAAVAVIAGCLTVVPERWQVPSAQHPGGVSLADRTYPSTWLHAIFAAPSEGGLPEDSVIVSWWSASTLLWYGQRVERLRPDVYIVDDRTRLDDNLGEVWDVIDRFLGQRPVFVIRMTGGRDGMDVIGATYDLAERPLPDGSTIWQVISKKGMP